MQPKQTITFFPALAEAFGGDRGGGDVLVVNVVIV